MTTSIQFLYRELGLIRFTAWAAGLVLMLMSVSVLAVEHTEDIDVSTLTSCPLPERSLSDYPIATSVGRALAIDITTALNPRGGANQVRWQFKPGSAPGLPGCKSASALLPYVLPPPSPSNLPPSCANVQWDQYACPNPCVTNPCVTNPDVTNSVIISLPKSLTPSIALDCPVMVRGTPTARSTVEVGPGQGNAFTLRLSWKNPPGATIANEECFRRYVFNIVNIAPTIGLPSGPLNYVENPARTDIDGATVIDSGATATDPDSADLDGGTLTVNFSADGSADDRLAIKRLGLIDVDTTTHEVTYGTDTIGTYTGGTGITALVVTFNANSTPVAVEALMRNITYGNVSRDPAPGARTVEFVLTDGDSGTSNRPTKTINVATSNDPPTLSANPANPFFQEPATGHGTAPAVNLFSAAAASTVEAGQKIINLTFTVSGLLNGADETISVDGTTIQLANGTNLGTTATHALDYTVNITGGAGTVTLQKASGMSDADIAALINGINYQNTIADNPGTGVRVFTLTAIQDDGGATPPGQDTTTLNIASTVTVVPVNDAPTVTASAPTPAMLVEAGGGTAGINESSITLTKADVDGTPTYDTVFLVPANGWSTADNGATYTKTGTYGTATLTIASGVVSYLLDNEDSDTQALTPQSQNISDLFTVQVTDGTATASANAAFPITGSNDAPAVTAGTPMATLVEAGGVNNGTPGTNASSITLTKADVDGTASFETALLTANGWSTSNTGVTYTKTGTYGTATLTIATGGVGYALDNTDADTQALTQGQSVSDSFTVQVTDGTTTASANAVFPITGSNDAPTVTAGTPTATLVEAGGVNNGTPGTNASSITLTKADVDGTASFDTAFLTANGWSTSNAGVTYIKTGTYGTATLTIATGGVGYALDNNDADTQALTQGQSVSDPFTVQVTDGMATASADAVFPITGSNDAPTLTVAQATTLPTFTEMQGQDTKANAVALLTSATIVDDGPNPMSATVTITNTQAWDELLFTDTSEIQHTVTTAGPTNTPVVLTLTAKSGQNPGLTDFADALISVKFNNTSDAPDTTRRNFNFVVEDAANPTLSSAQASSMLDVLRTTDMGLYQDIDFDCTPPPGQGTYEVTVNTPIPNTGMDIAVLNAPGNVFWSLNPQNGCSSGVTALNYTCAGGITVTLPQPTTLNGSVASSAKVHIGGQPSITGSSDFTLTVKGDPFNISTNQPKCDRSYQFHTVTHSPAGGWGEPHITTVDGVNYDFQSAGEFVALRGDGLEIQTRQTPIAQTTPPSLSEDYTKHTGISSCVSVYSAVAASFGKHWVSYQPNFIRDPQTQTLTQDSSGMQLFVDGDLTTLGPEGICLDSDSTSAYPYSCGRVVIVKTPQGKKGSIEIHFPNKTRLVVTSEWWPGPKTWQLGLNVYGTAATEGIMGRIVGGWLPALPNGTSVGPRPEPTDQTPKAKAKALHDRYVALNEAFADAWRVTDATSHFYYPPGTSTADFTFDEWPRESPTTCDIAGKPAALAAKSALTAKSALATNLALNVNSAQPKTLADAKESCKEITDENRKANCEFDVMVTGYTGFANGYLLSQKFEPGRTETKVTDDKDPTKYEENVTFTATVAPAASRSGVGNPAGSVQFVIDDIMAGSPVALDATGRATWTTSNLPAFKHRIKANYIPSPGSTFKASTSPEEIHTVTATPIQWFWFFITAIVAVIGFLVRWFRQKQAG